jgi:hypothetical protein
MRSKANLLVLLVSLCAWGRPSAAQAPPAEPPEPRAMKIDEERLRHAYMKLMRYQSAAVDERVAESHHPAAPDDYVTLGVTVLRAGKIGEILGKKLSQFVSPRSDKVLVLTRRSRQEKKSVKHVAYSLGWKALFAKSELETKNNDGDKVSDHAGSCDARLKGYVAYTVSVRLAGKQRVYKALALHTGISKQGAIECLTLLDNVAKGIDGVLREQAPAIRSPWKAYVRSPLYKAIVADVRRSASEPRTSHNQPPPLRPVPRAIGFLPGDDAALKFGVAGLDSAFQPALFAAGGCCINETPRWTNSPPDFEGGACAVGDGQAGQLRMRVDWSVRWPDGQEDRTTTEGDGECGNGYLCEDRGDGLAWQLEKFYCWPRFGTPQVIRENTTLTWVQEVESAPIVFHSGAVLFCAGVPKFQLAEFSGFRGQPSVCRPVRRRIFEDLRHECRACCGR